MTLKRLICSFGIILILSMSFMTGYIVSVNYVYAASSNDEWQNVTTNDQLVEAFRYYCKSRDLTIEGTVADGVTSFTTNAFNGICKTLGINLTQLQAEIKYQTDGNIGTRFLFSYVGIDAFNRIFAQFLQDNELEIGDSANETDNTLYSGYYWKDDDGFGCLVTISRQTGLDQSTVTYVGTPYIYTASDLRTLVTSTYTLSSPFMRTVHYGNGRTYNYMFYYGSQGSIIGKGTAGINYPQTLILRDYSGTLYSGFPNIVFNTVSSYRSSGFYFGNLTGGNTNFPYNTHIDTQIVNSQNSSSCNVYLTTNNTVINNNTYEGDTIINNDGTPSDPNAPDPDDPNYNPYPDGGGTTTPSGNTGGGSGADDTDITFPNFNFQLPQINWSLGDLSEKFPFSIPFDLIAFFTVLNAEPRAPAIDADIPLGSWYTWHFEADFAQFDNYAAIIRNVEFIGFCVGLIYLTIKLVKG